MTVEPNMICLYFGNPEECQCCGGWTKAEGGPFLGDARFCSVECFEDTMELRARMAEQAATDWCPACGYDRGEHDPACKQLKEEAR